MSMSGGEMMKWEKPLMGDLAPVGPCHDPCPPRIPFDLPHCEKIPTYLVPWL